MSVKLNKLRLIAKRYRKDRDGATAVEFALLITPFCALMFAILELGIIFFFGASLNHALSETSRDIRVGKFQAACKGPADFKASICDYMKAGSSCMSKLRVDVQTTSSGRFEPDMLPVSPPAVDTSDPSYDPNAAPPILPDTYENTSGRAPVMLRAQYYYKMSLPTELTRLANTSGNVRVIQAVTAFRNEPFPGGC